MSIIQLLYRDSYPINDKISIMIPKVGDILEDEANYYGAIAALTAMPIDVMVQLDDMGIDFTQINEYELFLLLFKGVREQDTHLIFGDLDLTKFKIGINEATNELTLVNDIDDIVINRRVQAQIAATLRKIHHLEKNKRKPGNKEAKQYMLERARIKQSRQKHHNEISQIEQLIVALVNTSEFKYNYESVRDLSIYQFNESVQQIVRKIDYDNKMFGVYTGNIRATDLSQDDFNWLSHK